jgi:hypothetical protein
MSEGRPWIVCPRCDGDKTITVIVCPGCQVVTRECDLCAGSGVLPPHRAEWWKTGNACRKWRQKEGLTLRKAAELAGMTATEYSRQEQGKTSPQPIFGFMVQQMMGEIEAGDPAKFLREMMRGAGENP